MSSDNRPPVFIYPKAVDAIRGAQSRAALDVIRVEYLGKKGIITGTVETDWQFASHRAEKFWRGCKQDQVCKSPIRYNPGIRNWRFRRLPGSWRKRKSMSLSREEGSRLALSIRFHVLSGGWKIFLTEWVSISQPDLRSRMTTTTSRHSTSPGIILPAPCMIRSTLMIM